MNTLREVKWGKAKRCGWMACVVVAGIGLVGLLLWHMVLAAIEEEEESYQEEVVIETEMNL